MTERTERRRRGVEPIVYADGVPICSTTCPSHREDGTCEITQDEEGVCEPAVLGMVGEIARLHEAELMAEHMREVVARRDAEIDRLNRQIEAWESGYEVDRLRWELKQAHAVADRLSRELIEERARRRDDI